MASQETIKARVLLVMVALTGYDSYEDLERSRDAGFDHHLVKPVDLEELRSLLDELPTRSG